MPAAVTCRSTVGAVVRTKAKVNAKWVGRIIHFQPGQSDVESSRRQRCCFGGKDQTTLPLTEWQPVPMLNTKPTGDLYWRERFWVGGQWAYSLIIGAPRITLRMGEAAHRPVVRGSDSHNGNVPASYDENDAVLDPTRRHLVMLFLIFLDPGAGFIDPRRTVHKAEPRTRS